MRAMFLEALQAYFAPTVMLVFFSFILCTDQLLTRQERALFLKELGIVGLMILTTWLDRCVSAVTVDGWWKLRFFTSAMQFAAAPLSPLTLLWIYRRNNPVPMRFLYVLPAVVTALLSVSSIWTGLVLRVEPGNVYSRGPLFLLPFAASAFYMVVILYAAARQESPGRRLETVFLLCAGGAIAGACILEILFVIRYMIWSTTAVMLLAYFLIITILKVLYDPQTGVYSRLAYSKRLAYIRPGQALTLAMIDLNGLKAINDRYGHKAGDQAIEQVSQALLSIPMRGKKLYRYGGDEFVLLVEGWHRQELEERLGQLSTNCGAVHATVLSFAFGVVEHHGEDLLMVTDQMDALMYKHKAEMKRTQPVSAGGE